mgnify:CR=1 FL=1
MEKYVKITQKAGKICQNGPKIGKVPQNDPENQTCAKMTTKIRKNTPKIA